MSRLARFLFIFIYFEKSFCFVCILFSKRCEQTLWMWNFLFLFFLHAVSVNSITLQLKYKFTHIRHGASSGCGVYSTLRQVTDMCELRLFFSFSYWTFFKQHVCVCVCVCVYVHAYQWMTSDVLPLYLHTFAVDYWIYILVSTREAWLGVVIQP